MLMSSSSCVIRRRTTRDRLELVFDIAQSVFHSEGHADVSGYLAGPLRMGQQSEMYKLQGQIARLVQSRGAA